ncbi:hypothetical protein [Nocardia nova]|uniref:hypothetical protein n=1 Tax=Nocardia nova TaxID=37330 RepID=UPI0033FBC3CA
MPAPLTLAQRNEILTALDKLALNSISEVTRAAVHASNAVMHNTPDQADLCRALATIGRQLTEIGERLAEDAAHRQ